MYFKTCPYCLQKSYSSSTARWTCPYCRKDISLIPWDIASSGEVEEAKGNMDQKKEKKE